MLSKQTDLLDKVLKEHTTLTREIKNLCHITRLLVGEKQGELEDEAREILNKIEHMIP